jgi:hypothetical protein
MVNKPARDWRDHTIIQVGAGDVDKLTVQADSKLVLEKVPGGEDAAGKKPATWKIVESPPTGPKEGDFDGSQPNTVIQALSQLRASDFAEGKSAKDVGLEPPAMTLGITVKDQTQTIEVGAQQGDDYYVRHTGDPTIFIVKKYTIERALARPIDYRDKVLLHYKADEVSRLHVVQGKDETALTWKDNKWTEPHGPVDDGKAKAMVGGVENLVGTSFVTDKAVKTELDKPRATITVELKGGTKATLKVGALTKDNADYYAAREGRKDVLLVKKFAIDRILKKPADLAPGPTGPPHGKM